MRMACLVALCGACLPAPVSGLDGCLFHYTESSVMQIERENVGCWLRPLLSDPPPPAPLTNQHTKNKSTHTHTYTHQKNTKNRAIGECVAVCVVFLLHFKQWDLALLLFASLLLYGAFHLMVGWLIGWSVG